MSRFVSKERQWHTYRCNNCGTEVVREAKRQGRQIAQQPSHWWESEAPAGWQEVGTNEHHCATCREAVADALASMRGTS